MKRRGIGADELCQRTEFAEQRLGERLGVAARDGEREQIFDQFIVGEAVGVVEQTRAQPRPVTEMIRLVPHGAAITAL